MPVTRSQTRKMARSSGMLSRNVSQTKSKATRRQSQHAANAKHAQHQDSQPTLSCSRRKRSFRIKAEKILWRLVEKTFPTISTTVLKPFRKLHRSTSSILCLILLVVYFVYNWGPLKECIISSISLIVFRSSSSKVLGEKILTSAPRHFWIQRMEEIKNCSDQLHSLARTHKGREIHLYIVGGPGSGKSELARQVGQFLYDTKRERNGPTDVLTIEAETADSIMHSFVEAIILLSKTIRQPKEKNASNDWISQIRNELNLQRDLFQKYREGDVLSVEKKIKILFAQLKEILKLRKSQPILIFDNVQSLKVLYEYLRLEPGREDTISLQIVITVQKRDSLPRLSQFVGVVDLYDGMSQKDSVNLLNLITGLNEDPDVSELADVLGKQPLALAAAAVYIESVRVGPPRRSSYSYFDYLSEFQQDMELLGREIQIEWEESLGSSYLDAMHIAILKATNRTAQIDPVLRDIACAVGFADTASISLSYILDYLKTNSHYSFLDAQVRNTLRNCVLFKVGGTEGNEQLLSHQITRGAFRKICKVSCLNLNCSFNTYCTILFNTKAKGKGGFSRNLLEEKLLRVVSAFQKQMYYKHSFHNESKNVSELIYFSTNGSFASQSLDILSSLCIYTTEENVNVDKVLNNEFLKLFLSFYANGYSYWPSLVKSATNEYKLRYLSNLTAVKSKGSRYDLQTLLIILRLHNGAVKSEKESLVTSLNQTSKMVIEDVLDRASCSVSKNTFFSVLLNILGVMYRGLGYPYFSRDLHHVALKSNENNETNETQMLEKATTLHKLGIINRYLGNLTFAEECHLNSSRILKRLYGRNHSSYAASLLNLAVVYSRQTSNQSLKALKLYNSSLAIMQYLFGPKHPHVGRVLNTLGTVYYKLGKFDTAIQYSERALRILENYHGSYHPHVAEALTFLGFMYRDKGHLKKSRDVLERSLTIKDTIFNPDHFILGETMNDLGVVYTRLGEPQKALVMLTRALKIFQKTWGNQHSATATATNSLGSAYLLLGETLKAKALHEKALNIFMKTDGSKSHSVAETLTLLAKAYHVVGKVKECIELYNHAYVSFKNLYGAQHWRVESVRYQLNYLQSDAIINKGALFKIQVNLVVRIALSLYAIYLVIK